MIINDKGPIPQWLQDVSDFADALSERAEVRSHPFFRKECKDDVEYMRKAARLLKMMAVAYYELTCQVNRLYENEAKLAREASQAFEVVQNQMKKL